MNTHIKLLNDFIEWDAETINGMEKVSHHFDVTAKNPFHVEGPIWTHTMLLYHMLCRESAFLYDFLGEDITLLSIGALCHDIGKIYTRNSFASFGKVNFYNHAFASVQPAIDFMLWLNDTKKYTLSANDMYKVILTISNHMDFLQSTDPLTKKKLCNNDPRIIKIAVCLSFLDRVGVLSNTVDYSERINNVEDEYKAIALTPTNTTYTVAEPPSVVLFCGPPGIGKDTLARKFGLRTVSLDNCRIEAYLRENSAENDDITLYEKAFSYVKEKNTNLMSLLQNDIYSINPTTENPMAICNTNLTRKLRRSMYKLVADKVVTIVYLVSSRGKVSSRNSLRTDKKIDNKVLYKFLFNQQVPSLEEVTNHIKVNSIDLIVC